MRNFLHFLFLVAAGALLSACAHHPKSGAHMYEGDTSPAIRMYDEGPGSPLHN